MIAGFLACCRYQAEIDPLDADEEHALDWQAGPLAESTCRFERSVLPSFYRFAQHHCKADDLSRLRGKPRNSGAVILRGRAAYG